MLAFVQSHILQYIVKFNISIFLSYIVLYCISKYCNTSIQYYNIVSFLLVPIQPVSYIVQCISEDLVTLHVVPLC